MSLREELERQIRFEVSADPVMQRALLPDEIAATSLAGGIAALNVYCDALMSALLNMADEFDTLRGG